MCVCVCRCVSVLLSLHLLVIYSTKPSKSKILPITLVEDFSGLRPGVPRHLSVLLCFMWISSTIHHAVHCFHTMVLELHSWHTAPKRFVPTVRQAASAQANSFHFISAWKHIFTQCQHVSFQYKDPRPEANRRVRNTRKYEWTCFPVKRIFRHGRVYSDINQSSLFIASEKQFSARFFLSARCQSSTL